MKIFTVDSMAQHGRHKRILSGVVTLITLLTVMIQLVPSSPLAPVAHAAGVQRQHVNPLKSKMRSHFASMALTGTNCASSSASPLIFNCGVLGVTAGSATIVWESDVNATASLCFNTTAYSTAQCQINNGNAHMRCGDTLYYPNPGLTILDNTVSKQQLPTGNWLYNATVPVLNGGTFHYQIVMQNSAGVTVVSNDETFAAPSTTPTYQDSFGGAAVASSPFFSEPWTGAADVASGANQFQDTFSAGSTLSSNWTVPSGSWAVDSTNGFATTASPGAAYETPTSLGATAGTGELITSITLPAVTTQDPYDNAGLILYEDPNNPYAGTLVFVLDTTANCQSNASNCASGEMASGLWLTYKAPSTGTLTKVYVSANTPGGFTPGTTYTFDVRVSGAFVSVYDRTAPTNPWQYVTSGVATTSINGTTYSITKGPSGLWDNAASTTPVQFGAFNMYSTATTPTGFSPNPTTSVVNAVFAPTSTSTQGTLSAGTALPLGVAVTNDNDEVEFSSDALGGIVVRANGSGVGEQFSVALTSTTITGTINGGGSSGQVSGTGPWQLQARFDGQSLSLYGKASGATSWSLLAAGGANHTAGGYVWPLPTANGVIGAFSLSQITTPAVTHWAPGGNGPASSLPTRYATTSNDPNTPGQLWIKQSSNPYWTDTWLTTHDINLSDGTLEFSFTSEMPDRSYLMFDVNNGDLLDAYQIWFYQQFDGIELRHMYQTRDSNGNVSFNGNEIGGFPNTCSMYSGAPSTVYLIINGLNVCVAVGGGTWTMPDSELCFALPAGLKGTGIGFGQDEADIGLSGVRYFAGHDGGNWYGPGQLTTGANVGVGSYSDAATDLALTGKGATDTPQAGFTGNSGLTGLTLPGHGLPLAWSRSYNSAAAAQNMQGPLGIGTAASYARSLTINGDSSVSISNANGSLETFAYDTANASYTPPGGSQETLVHNADGSFTLTAPDRVADTFQVVNANGPSVMTKQTDSDGNVTTVSYTSANALASVKDSVGRQLNFTENAQPIGPYAAGALITSVTDGTRTVSYGYDATGNLTAVTDPDGYTTTYAYQSSLNPHLLTQRCDANNQPGVVGAPKCVQNTYAADPGYDPAHGLYAPSGGFRLTQQLDPSGVATQYVYNMQGTTAAPGFYQVLRDPGNAPHLNQMATYQVNGFGEPTSFTDPLGVATQYGYDRSGRLISTTVDAAANGLNSTWQRQYDHLGNLVETTDPNGNTVQYSYGTTAGAPDFNQITQVVVDPVPPSGGTHLNATYSVQYYPVASSLTGFSGNPGDIYAITDPLGHATYFSYDTAGNVTRVQDADGHNTTYAYDSYGQLAQVIVDPTSLNPSGLNLVSSYQSDRLGRLVSQTDPTGVATTYTYDLDGRVLTHVADPSNATTNPQGLNVATAYTYDKVGNVLSQTVDPTPSGGATCVTTYGGLYRTRCHMNEKTTYSYDVNNRLVQVVSPINGAQVTYPGATSATTLSGITTYTYDAASNQTSVTDPLGRRVRYAYDADGHMTQVSGPLDGVLVVYPTGLTHRISGTTQYEYDGMGRVTSVTDPAGLVTAYTYDHTKNVTSTIEDPSGAALTQSWAYDSAGRMTDATDVRGNVTSYAYDFAGHVVAAQSPLGELTQYTDDAMGRTISQVVDPLPQGQTSGHANLVTQYSYDTTGRLTSTVVDPTPQGGSGHLNLTSAVTYDADGRVTQATDPNGHLTKYSFDHLGRQLTATDAHAVATNGAAWRFVYDYLGNTRQVTDPLGHVTTTQYDGLNRPIQQVVDPNPLGGGGHLQLTSSQYFDSDGEALYSTNANGQTSGYTYDGGGRLTQVSYHSATTPDVTYAYNDDSRPLYMTDGTGAKGSYWSTVYDTLGRTLSVTDPTGKQYGYSYDASGAKGDLTGVTYPSGHGLAMTYDQDGRLATLSSPNNTLFGSGTGASTTSFQYTYNSAGQLTQASYPNGVAASYTYDTAGRMVAKSAAANGNSLAAWAYTLDNAGNPTQISDSTVGGAQQVTFGYDEANRLTGATYWDGQTQAYVYDGAGNRTSLTTNGGSPVTSTYDGAGRLTAAGGTTFSYDHDGNRTSAAVSGGTTTTYNYDQADRLIGVGGVGVNASYTYDGTGMRASATDHTSNTTTVYQWDPRSGALLGDGTNEYVGSAGGGLLAQTPLGAGASGVAYGLPDALGSTRLLTNSTGQTQATMAYDAYGNPKQSTGTLTSPLGFTGQLTDTTGLQNLRARMYDPQTGQFLSRDSYAGTAGSPTSLNRYTYGLDAPTSNTDPSGHCSGWSDCLGAVGDALSSFSGAAQSFGGSLASTAYNAIDTFTGGGLDALQAYTNDAASVAQQAGQGMQSVANVELQQSALGYFSQTSMSQVATSVAIFAIVAIAGAELVPVVGIGLGLMGLDGAAGFFATSAIVGAATGMLGQGLSNVASGRPWDEGLGQAALGGAVAGVVLGAVGEAFAADGGSGSACELSFAPSTLVATPNGEQTIGSLAVGDTVLAYNPMTGKREPEPVQHLWRNYDHDLVDVQLTTSGGTASSSTASGTAGATTQQTQATTTTARLHRWVRQGVLAAGLAATLLPTATGGAVAQAAPPATAAPAFTRAPASETIHTTANHPWLTADRGWVHAGDLRPGEQVVTLPAGSDASAASGTTSSGTATVAAVRVAPGAGEMDNLTVAQDHTYAVGASRAVVHNTEGCGEGGDKYFVHGTTTNLWDESTSLDARGGGDFGKGFYTFEDTPWGRKSAWDWANVKTDRGGDPILVRVKMPMEAFQSLVREDVSPEALDTAFQFLYPDRLSGNELVVGPVGKTGLTGERVPKFDLPYQFKFEGSGVGKLQIDGILQSIDG